MYGSARDGTVDIRNPMICLVDTLLMALLADLAWLWGACGYVGMVIVHYIGLKSPHCWVYLYFYPIYINSVSTKHIIDLRTIPPRATHPYQIDLSDLCRIVFCPRPQEPLAFLQSAIHVCKNPLVSSPWTSIPPDRQRPCRFNRAISHLSPQTSFRGFKSSFGLARDLL